MKTTALRTHRIECKESLHAILDCYIPALAEHSIVVITSKIVSLCQGRVVPKPIEADAGFKEALIKQEADSLLKTSDNLYGLYLTLKNNILIPSAGIDESNGDNVYILYPQDIYGHGPICKDFFIVIKKGLQTYIRPLME